MSDLASHPTDQILQSYGLGKLDDASAASVNEHLDSCPECQRRVAEVAPDSFLGRLRKAPELPDTSATDKSQFGASLIGNRAGEAGPPPAAETLPPGLAEHPDYEVVRELGQGGMGTVYLAKNRLMGRLEVLKVVSGHLMNRRGVTERFSAEIRNAARLHHTNIVTAYSASRAGESIVFAMEYVEGLDLSRLVKAKGALPVANACNYIHQASLGLQHAHELGMVHRDIKPSNLMLARQANRAIIKVLDFGLAKVKSEGAVDGGLTHEGQMLGTPDYIAPEQIRDARDADIRADIYSLGCTFYYLLMGKPPFEANSLYEILQAHHSMDAMPLNLGRPEVPVELAALVAKMMAKEPERRFQTPAEVARELTPFFKKASAPIKSLNPGLSKNDQTGTIDGKRAVISVPNESIPNSGPINHSGTARSSGIAATADRQRPDDARETARVMADALAFSGQTQRRVWRSVAAGVLVLGLVVALAATWIWSVKTAKGELVFSDLPAQAEVTIDGEVCTVEWASGKVQAKVTVAPGTHKIEVTHDGIEIVSEQEVTIAAGEKRPIKVQFVNSESSPRQKNLPLTSDDSAATKAIKRRLEKVIRINFVEETPLDEGLKYIKEKTKEPNQRELPIYVDPVGLSEADKTMASPFAINTVYEKSPLRITLRRILGQLGLDYCVKDGVLFIGSPDGTERERRDLPILAVDAKPETAMVLKFLERPLRMSFESETPLENVINYIKESTKVGDKNFAFDIELSPIGLSEADKTAASPVRMLDLEGVPLKTTLRLLLRQLDLAFYVEEGVLIITSAESVQKTLKGVEGKDKSELKRAVPAENVQENPNDGAEAGGLAKEAGASKSAPLFDGTQNGWEDLLPNGSKWSVSEGILEGKGGGDKKPALFLYERQTYANFRLRVQFRFPEEGGAWIEVRRSPVGNNSNGYMIFISSGATTDGGLPPTGSITKLYNYEYGTGLGWAKRAESDPVPVNEWRTLEIVALRGRIISSMEGKTLADYTDAVGWYGSGGIAIGARGDSRIQLKDIRIEELGE